MGEDGRLLWRASTLTVDVSAYPFATLPVPNQPAVLGIRPEHIQLTAPDASAGQATVTLAEPMGASVVLWLDLGGNPVSVVAESHTPHQRGHSLGLRCDAQRVSLFDTESGQRL